LAFDDGCRCVVVPKLLVESCKTKKIPLVPLQRNVSSFFFFDSSTTLDNKRNKMI
jgi:hypothetical protein